MSNDQDLVKLLSDYICAELASNPPDGPIAPDFQLIEGGLVDSLGLFKLIAFLEDKLGVTVEPDEILFENFASIDAIIALVEAKRSAA